MRNRDMRSYNGHQVYLLEERTEWKRFELFHKLTFLVTIKSFMANEVNILFENALYYLRS